MLAFLAVIAAAQAAPILSVGEPTNMGLTCACHWARVFARPDGLVDLFVTGGGNYSHVELQRLGDGTWQALGAARPLTSIDALIDHAITPCPDGTWLHVASSNRTELGDDSFYMMHYGADFEILAQRLVVDSDTVLRYNDAPLVCDARTVATVGHPRDLDSHDGELLWFAADGRIADQRYFDTIPPVGGSSLVWDPRREEYLSFRALGPDSGLFVVFLDREFQQTGPWKLISLDPAPPYLSWPQAVVPLGDGWAVAHLVRRDSVAYASDQGDIQITVLDENLDLVQSVRVTTVEEGSGAHRPGLTRVGDELLVSYEVELEPRLVVLALDPDLPPEPDPETGLPGWLELPPEDTGTPGDSGTPADTSEPEPEPEPEPDPEPDAVVRPGADAGPDRTVVLGTPVQLDGSASTLPGSGPDSGPLAFSWTTDTPGLALDAADQPVAVFQAPEPGTYTFRLVVTADGRSDTDSVVVTVSEERACGCAAAPGAALWLWPLLPLVVRRRRTPSA